MPPSLRPCSRPSRCPPSAPAHARRAALPPPLLAPPAALPPPQVTPPAYRPPSAPARAARRPSSGLACAARLPLSLRPRSHRPPARRPPPLLVLVGPMQDLLARPLLILVDPCSSSLRPYSSSSAPAHPVPDLFQPLSSLEKLGCQTNLSFQKPAFQDEKPKLAF
ncbi:classical arabinogalactan protein 9-like [Setaria italica]|uniref:classical arabinogalactan protein 9-like n=1 Tax=Setaria italica TaxID=4555 RepID=UPI000BE62935|nr:classical arabinogalactan protein 9-like [Setaria italica]